MNDLSQHAADYQALLTGAALTDERSGTQHASGSNSWDSLISPYFSILSNWVKSRTPKSLSADDVIQQTLVLALKNMASLRIESSVGTWLCAIAQNVIRGQLRSPHYSRLSCLDVVAHELFYAKDPSPSPLEFLERQEASDLLLKQIALLPECYRIVVERIDLEGHSTDEIVNELCITKSALKSRHYRAKKMLRTLLNEEMERRDKNGACKANSSLSLATVHLERKWLEVIPLS